MCIRDRFEGMSQDLAPVLGDLMILDDEDERLWLKRNGRFEAEVIPERDPEDDSDREGDWRRLESPDSIVEFYDPTDVFGDLAEALADSFPAVAADEDAEEEEEEEKDSEAEAEAEAEADADANEDEDANEDATDKAAKP